MLRESPIGNKLTEVSHIALVGTPGDASKTDVRLHHLLFEGGQIPNENHFFDLYDKEGARLELTEKDQRGTWSGMFTRRMERQPPDNVDAVRLIQELSQQMALPHWSDKIEAARSLFHGEERYLVERDISKMRENFAGALRYFSAIEGTLITYRETLERHPLLGQYLNQIATNVAHVRKILATAGVRISQDKRGCIEEVVTADADALSNAGLARDAHVQTGSVVLYQAIADFVRKSGLAPYVEEALFIGLVMSYACIVHENDHEHYGVYPDVRPADTHGFRFRFEQLHHPLLIRKGQRKDCGLKFVESMRHPKIGMYLTFLVNNGCLTRNGIGNYNWCEGLTIDALARAVCSVPFIAADADLNQKIISHFLESCSLAFGNVELGEINATTGERETIMIVDADNMSGKSALMKAIGLSIHQAQMGRKVAAAGARLTMCDRIFHNWDIIPDIREQASTSKAQLQNIRQFLDDATIQSLGLFDEFLHGMDSPYRLAFAWSFLEECRRDPNRLLRVVVCMQDSNLRYFTDHGGYEKLRGAYQGPVQAANAGSIRGSKVATLDSHHTLQSGRARNPDRIFEIASEVMGDKYAHLVERSRQIFLHLSRLQ